VDLSGAERGFVLLVDARGQLEKRTVQVARAAEPDPHEAFSRSIAEAVLIDGEAIVTVDATRDGRLSEYVSVHKLMLRSVACLPIRSRSATVGVLYLEHRRSRGRFSEASVELLSSFADQAAIALENARLISENKRRQQELETLNEELVKAKQGLEELLTARTEQLAEAKRELGRSRSAAREASTRHNRRLCRWSFRVKAARVRSSSRARFTTAGCGHARRSSRSTAAAFRMRCSRASCSVTCAAHLVAPTANDAA